MTDYDRPVALPTLTWGLSAQRRALLLHGLSSSAASWWQIADSLAQLGWQVTAPDLRGHGTAPHTRSYRLSGYAADLWQLGHDWDLVVGHALGGTLGALTAGRPGFAGRLVLLDPVFIVPDDRFDQALADGLRELAEAGDPHELQRLHPAWHPEDVAQHARALMQTSPYVVEHTLADNRPWWYLDLLSDLDIQTTIVGADPANGAMFEPTIGEEIARRNPRISTLVVAGSGHAVHRDNPSSVLDVISA